MSGIGTTTAEEVFSERVELQPRTSDPSSTEEGEGWIRSDIAPDSNQIATFRVDTGGSTIDVPILQTGTSTDGVVEALRLSVGGALGYVPAIPESKAAFPALRLQHNGQVYGWHDARGETAFFDVAIDSTNSPITEGNTLTVDYSVQNTGGALNDTQDIRLDVGSTERDRDSGVSIASGASATGQLSWGSAVEGSYTASVLSDDDVASTTVNVERVIPDSGLLHEWDAQALSATDGETIDPLPDQQGTLNLPASGAPSFETTTNISEPAVFYDGEDDKHNDSSFGGAEDATITIGFVIEPLRTNTLETFATVNHSAIKIDLRLDNGVWNVTFPSIGEITGGTYAANSTYAGVFLYDGSTTILDIGDTTPINTSSNTDTTSTTGVQVGSDDGGRYVNFHSHYVSIYDDAKDSQTRQEVISGLESKFGFTSANA